MKTSHLIILISSLGALLVLFFVLYLGGSSFVLSLSGERPSESAPSGIGIVGKQLPYFDLPTLTGDRARSSDFAQTPVIIVFWSTWNMQAADEIHILDQYLSDQTPSSSLARIVAINSQEERSIVSSFMSRGKYQVETLLDGSGLTGSAYALKSVPTFYFIDREGTVREVYAGVLSEKALMNKIENILQ